MKLVLYALAAALFLAGPAAAAHKRVVVTQPDWLKKPTGDDLQVFYPKAASALDLEGRAVITCTVSEVGDLTNCKTVSEAPAGLGFGQAALNMAGLFRMRPMTRDGRPVDGGLVTVPIIFGRPDVAAAVAAPTQKVDDTRLALGRRYVAALKWPAKRAAGMNQQIDRLAFVDDDVTPLETREAAVAALRNAYAAVAAELDEVDALAVAETLTGPQLERWTLFLESPLSAAFVGTDNTRAVAAVAARETQARLRRLAAESFCHQRDCDVASILTVPSGATIGNPIWSEAPSIEEIRAVEPPALSHLAVAVAARLRCRVEDNASLEYCSVVAERPAGLGFGVAVAELSSKFRLHPLAMAQGAAGEAQLGSTAAAKEAPVWQRYYAEARAAFCKDHPCQIAARPAPSTRTP